MILLFLLRREEMKGRKTRAKDTGDEDKVEQKKLFIHPGFKD